jgi:ATP-dependent exoDNAse (exonuclease V) alpha subunit
MAHTTAFLLPLAEIEGVAPISNLLADGDRIQFTAPDKSLGVANRDLATIDAIHLDGRVSVRLDNNRQIEFNASEHRHFDHGYAVTSHSSQGLTAERVLVDADTKVHPALLNSRFAYVSISRASHERSSSPTTWQSSASS